MSMKTYEFVLSSGETLRSEAADAVSAFHSLKKANQNSYNFEFKKYSDWGGELPPAGYSLLGIGYGLSVAYKIRTVC